MDTAGYLVINGIRMLCMGAGFLGFLVLMRLVVNVRKRRLRDYRKWGICSSATACLYVSLDSASRLGHSVTWRMPFYIIITGCTLTWVIHFLRIEKPGDISDWTPEDPWSSQEK